MLTVSHPSILDIEPYAPGKSSRKGAKSVKLSSNENAHGPHPGAVEAYQKAAARLHRYPDGGATLLREALGAAHGLDPARIVCGAGSDELIGLLVHAYGAGGEILYSARAFLMYRIYALAAGATPVAAPEKGLAMDVDAILGKVTERTRIVFLANPNNPTGDYLSAGAVRRLREKLPANVLLALDAAYAEYVTVEDYAIGAELVDAGGENTVLLRTFSKIYGLPSLRLGWMYGPASVVKVMHRVRGPFNVSGPAQAAGIAAASDAGWVETHRRLNAEQMARLRREVEGLGLETFPSQGNFFLARFADAAAARRVIKELAAREIYIRDVTAYGLPDYARITVGRPEDNEALLAALREILARA